MALGLVSRTAVALSDHLNAIYRVLKGSDPDSVALRLPAGGFFQVRHSGTNAAVFSVTDAGVAGIIQGGDIVDNTITSAEIANDTIVNGDISPNAAIAVTKLGGGGTANRVVATADGTNVAMQQVTSAMIADGTITTVDMTANTINADRLADGTVTSAKIADLTIVNGDVAAAAAIAYSKLNLASSITSADIADQAIMNADVNNAAGIVVAKLGAGGTANRVVATTNGSAMTMEQVNSSMILGQNVIAAHLSGGGAGDANTVLRTTTGTACVFGKVVSADIADDTIMNTDINSAAGIGLAKLAHVGANYVLRSNGTTNVGGPIVTNDMVINTIDADRLLNGSITAGKLGAGITAPATALLLTSGVLAGPAAIIDFPGIPGTYKHLEIHLYGRSAGAATTNQLRFQINGDAGGAYHGESQQVFASSTSQVEHAPGSTDGILGHVPAAGASAAMFGAYVISIPHYTDASNYTALISRGGYASSSLAGNVAMVSAFCMYYGPGAVTRITLYPTAGNNWAAGTLANLYGLT